MIKIAVMGFGVVGSGVVEVCDKNGSSPHSHTTHTKKVTTPLWTHPTL